MIFINGSGRCGNQMFQYAFARLLVRQYGEQDIVFCTEKILKTGEKRISTNVDNLFWENSLKYFQCNFIESDETFRRIVLKNGSLKQIACYFLWMFEMLFYTKVYAKRGKIAQFKKGLMKLWKRNRKNGLFFYPDGVIEIPKNIRCKNLFISGTFEIASLYDGVENEMRQIFTPIKINDDNELLMAQIKANDSVCISMRKWIGEFQHFQVCDEDYYRKAISFIKKQLKNPTFIIFSDDIDWAKKQSRK